MTTAHDLGTERGKAAASWVFDGNTSTETYANFLRLDDDGDPALYDTFGPTSGWLSGEFADAPTPRTLAEDLGISQDDDVAMDDAFSTYEDAADAAYWAELRRVATLHTEGS